MRCFVVGDDPALDVIHIPMMSTPVKNDRYMDVSRKLLVISNTKEINEEYILMYDDIYLLQPTSEEEIKKTYGREELTDLGKYRRMGDKHYIDIWRSTYDYIKTYRDTQDKKTYDWETHLPRWIEKAKMKEVIKRFKLTENNKLPTGMYHGHYVEETVLMDETIQSDLFTHKPKWDLDLEFSRKYLNLYDDAIVPELVERIKAHMA